GEEKGKKPRKDTTHPGVSWAFAPSGHRAGKAAAAGECGAGPEKPDENRANPQKSRKKAANLQIAIDNRKIKVYYNTLHNHGEVSL
ncbi:MAG TPA: hypothetical protein H9684_04580, partial [Firmicutes bacterium]|nr:hypothetical protein [Bacillota bacterium]